MMPAGISPRAGGSLSNALADLLNDSTSNCFPGGADGVGYGRRIGPAMADHADPLYTQEGSATSLAVIRALFDAAERGLEQGGGDPKHRAAADFFLYQMEEELGDP